MKIKMILLLALGFSYNCFAAQANNNQIKITTVVGVSDEGHTQRIITAKYGDVYYRRIITYVVNSNVNNTLDFNVCACSETNAKGNTLYRLENEVSSLEQVQIIQYLATLTNTNEITKGYFGLRGAKNKPM